jgi:hypothetical protein
MDNTPAQFISIFRSLIHWCRRLTMLVRFLVVELVDFRGYAIVGVGSHQTAFCKITWVMCR